MPLPIVLAHGLARRLDEVRSKGVVPYLAPDGKTLVAVEFDDDRPTRIHAVIVSAQHTEALDRPDRLEADIRDAVLAPVFDPAPIGLDQRTTVLIRCEVQLSYGVGEEHPLAVAVQTSSRRSACARPRDGSMTQAERSSQ